MKLRVFIGVVVVVALFGVALFAYERSKNPGPVSENPAPTAVTASPEDAPTVPVGQGPPGLSGAGKTRVGEILEVIDVRGYTYIRLQEATGDQIWAAVSKTDLKAGETVTLVESMTMREFQSPTLNRTFETIIFGALADGTPTAGQAYGLPEGHPRIPAGPLEPQPTGAEDAEAQTEGQ